MSTDIVFYDTGEPKMGELGQRAASASSAKGIAVDSIATLLGELTQLQRAGTKVSRMVFMFHGTTSDTGGMIKIGKKDWLTAGTIQAHFTGKGFQNLFVHYGIIEFPTCNVARSRPICIVNGNVQPCVDTDNGWVFMSRVAQTFLSGGGGRVSAWTSTGYSWPWTSESLHFSGNIWHALVSPGGTRLRMAAGKRWHRPEGTWYVDRGTGPATKYEFDYPDVTWHTADGSEHTGVMDLQEDSLTINWDFGGLDEWYRPIFDRYTTGMSGIPLTAWWEPAGQVVDRVLDIAGNVGKVVQFWK